MKEGQRVKWIGPSPDRGEGTVTHETWMNGCWVLWDSGKDEPCYNANLRRVPKRDL